MKVTKENEEKEKMCSNSQPGAIREFAQGDLGGRKTGYFQLT